jgi:hypothetical protein
MTSRLASAVTVLFRARLPPDFVTPNWDQDTPESQEIDNKWTRCFKALSQVHDFVYLKCGRRVEDPASATFFISAFFGLSI